MNKILELLGLRSKPSNNKFSRFFSGVEGSGFSSAEKKRVIQQAIREANKEQRELVEKVERIYSN